MIRVRLVGNALVKEHQGRVVELVAPPRAREIIELEAGYRLAVCLVTHLPLDPDADMCVHITM